MIAVAIFIICVCGTLIIQATGSSIALAFYNEVKNISCDKRIEVMLLCEGVNLTELRWSIPSLGSSVKFLSDRSPQNMSVPIFPNVNPGNLLTTQLLDINVTLNSTNGKPTRANFSSILTLDLLELRNENVTKIKCGDTAISKEISVLELLNSIVKLEPNVMAAYQEGILTNIRVQIRNLFHLCLPILGYKVGITGSSEVQSVYSCTGPFCEVRFTAPHLHYDEEGNVEVTVVVLLTNQESLKEVDIPMNERIDHYFVPQVNSSDCSHTPECRRVLNESLSPCTVQYSTSLLPTLPTVPPSLDTPLPQQTPGTLHTFNFSLQVNEQLYITESISVTDVVPSLRQRDIAILTMTCMFLLLTLVHFMLVLIVAYCKMKVLTSKIKALIVSMVPLAVLVLVCISLLIAFGVITSTTACGLVESSPRDNILETLLVVSCLGITLLIVIWSYLGYSVYKQQKSVSVNKTQEEKKDDFVNRPEEEYSTVQHENDYYKSKIKHTSSRRNTDAGNKPGEEYSTIQYENDFYNNQGAMDIIDPFIVRNDEYASLQRPRSFLEDSCTVDNKHYRAKKVVGDSPYQQLRPGEKSKPVPNMLDPTYEHIARQLSEPVPDLVCSHSEHMRDNYHVLSRCQSVCAPDSNELDPESVYGELDESCMEPLGEGLYLPLRMMEKSKPVPNMEDPSYSHMQLHTPSLPGETGAAEATQSQDKKNKKKRFKLK